MKMLKKYEVAEAFRAGYIAALEVKGCPSDASEHFRAGYNAGYKAKQHLHDSINEHLKSKGLPQMAIIKLM